MSYEIGKEYIMITKNGKCSIVRYDGVDHYKDFTLNTYHKFGIYSLPDRLASKIIFEKTPLLEALL